MYRKNKRVFPNLEIVTKRAQELGISVTQSYIECYCIANGFKYDDVRVQNTTPPARTQDAC